MTRLFLTAIVAITCLGLLASPTWAQKVYKVGVEAQDYAPFSYVEKGEFKGLIRDVLDKFAQSKGYEFQYEAYPIPRLFRAYLEGKVDIKFPDHPYWATDDKKGHEIHYSEKGIPAINGVMTLAGDEEADPEELSRIGTVLGFTTPDLEKMADEKLIELYEVNKLHNLLKMLRKHHVRGIFFDANVARYYMNEQEATDLQLNKKFPFTLFEYRLSSILHPTLTDEFDTFLKTNQAWFKSRLSYYSIRQN